MSSKEKKMIGRYPKGYNGPKSGTSTAEEWAAVRDYQAYQWVIDGTWAYCDFDNYLYSMILLKNENTDSRNKTV